MGTGILNQLTDAERGLLEQFRFDAAKFIELQQDLAAGRFPPERNHLTEPFEPPPTQAITPWPDENGETARRWTERGRAALAAGEVGAIVLNGGMATRFGGVVKGVVEVFGGFSFLGVKLRGLRSLGEIPVFLMNSFATAATSAQHLRKHQHFGLPESQIHPVVQRISMRLTPEGDLFRDSAGNVSFYAPGHGDVFDVIAESEALSRFKDRGGKCLLVGNVDNLGATLHPQILGAHLELDRPVTVEVTARAPGDTGGAPTLVGNRVAIIEGFRYPTDFDVGQIPVFNTNTFTINLDAFTNYPMTWFRADKSVEGKPVVQFERLMGEVTSFVDAAYLEVPREGPEGRFLPVKTPDDLDALRPMLEARFRDAITP